MSSSITPAGFPFTPTRFGAADPLSPPSDVAPIRGSIRS
jgi:hypothetical protein